MPKPFTTKINPAVFEVAALTDAGRTGKNNEDNYALFESKHQRNGDTSTLVPAYVAVVADGIGGSASGEIASELAIQAFVESFEQSSAYKIKDRLEAAIHYANHTIHKRAQELPGAKGMGTTIVIALVVGDYLYVAHAGDSRAYLLRDGKNYLLTLDHTWAQEAIDAGYLTIEQAERHPNKNVIKRYLGPVERVEVDHRIIEVEQRQGDARSPAGRAWAQNDRLKLLPGDTLLLCSDGLADVVSDDEMAQIVARFDPRQAVRELIKAANNAGGPDNITAILLQRAGTRPRPASNGPVPRADVTEPWNPAGVTLAAEAKTKQPEPKQSRSKALWLAPLLALLIVGLAGGGVYLWRPELLNRFTAPTQTPGAQASAITTKNEITATATISSPSNAVAPIITISPILAAPTDVPAVATSTITDTLQENSAAVAASAQPTLASLSPAATIVLTTPTSTPVYVTPTESTEPPATSTMPSTPIPSATPTNEQIQGQIQRSPTSTPINSPTAISTDTPTPITPTPASLRPNRPSISPTGLQIVAKDIMNSAILDKPEPNAELTGEFWFDWRLVNASNPNIEQLLQGDYLFEVVILKDKDDPASAALGLAKADKAAPLGGLNHVRFNVEQFKGSTYDVEENKKYYWSVRVGYIVDGNFEAIGLLAEPRPFRFRYGGGSNNSPASPSNGDKNKGN